MPAKTAAVKSTVEKLRAILEREAALRGADLENAVAEKERLILELEQSLKLGEAGGGERAAALEREMAPLAFANVLALHGNRVRLQLGRLQKPPADAVNPPRRVDLIS